MSGFTGLTLGEGGATGVGTAATCTGVGVIVTRSVETEGMFSALSLHARREQRTNNITAIRLISFPTILRNYSEVS